MYYPGLFESATSYSALNSVITSSASNNISPFGKLVEGAQSAGQKTEAHALLGENGKKIISSQASHGGNNPFGNAHFPASHYRPQTAAPSEHHMMHSAYVPQASENLGSSFLHDQSFLEASTPYAINPLSSYPSYPTYIGNSVMGSTMKAPSSGTYPGHTSFYPPSGTAYSPYPDSFISEYITRNHIDANKAAYNSSTSDSSSFTEHLKRLQESFQSKSPKTSDSGTFHHQQYRPSSSHSTQSASYGNTQPVRPEPILLQPCSTFPKSTVISNNYPHHSYDAFNKVANCENTHKSTSNHPQNSTHSTVTENVPFKQQSSSDNQNVESAANCKSGDSIDQTIESCIAGNDLKTSEEISNQHTKELKVSSNAFSISCFMRPFVNLQWYIKNVDFFTFLLLYSLRKCIFFA